MIDVFEHERRRLVDGGRARPGGGIGLCARVDRERRKTRGAFGHGCVPYGAGRNPPRLVTIRLSDRGAWSRTLSLAVAVENECGQLPPIFRNRSLRRGVYRPPPSPSRKAFSAAGVAAPAVVVRSSAMR